MKGRRCSVRADLRRVVGVTVAPCRREARGVRLRTPHVGSWCVESSGQTMDASMRDATRSGRPYRCTDRIP